MPIRSLVGFFPSFYCGGRSSPNNEVAFEISIACRYAAVRLHARGFIQWESEK